MDITILFIISFFLLKKSSAFSVVPSRSLFASYFQPSINTNCYRHCYYATTSIAEADTSTQLRKQPSIPPLTATPPLRVLLIVEPTPFTYISGYANRFKEMLKYLKKAGDEVHIFTPDCDLANAPSDFLGFPITTVRGFNFPLYKQVTVSFDLRFRIGKIIDEFKPDIIHVSTPSMVVNAAILWAKLKNIPLITSYHTNLIEYGKAYVKLPGVVSLAKFLLNYSLSPADYLLTTSPQLKDDLQSLGLQRVGVWQKGINTELFSPKFRDATMRALLCGGEENTGAPLLLYVGRLGFEKRVDRLKRVLDRIPGVRLAIVGSGPAENQLKELFKGSPVVFTGPLTGERLSQAYASCDMFVMPSDSETLGFVVMEAMASGVPVVGVAAGGLLDIIADGETGYLAENADDMAEFSERVHQLTTDKDLRKRFGESGLAWAQSWSWEAATSLLRNIQYRAAIALHGARDETGKHVPDIAAAILKHSEIHKSP